MPDLNTKAQIPVSEIKPTNYDAAISLTYNLYKTFPLLPLLVFRN